VLDNDAHFGKSQKMTPVCRQTSMIGHRASSGLDSRAQSNLGSSVARHTSPRRDVPLVSSFELDVHNPPSTHTQPLAPRCPMPIVHNSHAKAEQEAGKIFLFRSLEIHDASRALAASGFLRLQAQDQFGRRAPDGKIHERMSRGRWLTF
jgi:hypothetical protein